MSGEPIQQSLHFSAADNAAEDGEALIVDLDGYEGPLHVLLALARTQKVDLLKLSILTLAEQYLAFVQQARRLRFSLAADYLVMAAWLAYLKSRLLLPKPQRATAESSAEEEAEGLAFRLAKLDAMRRAAEALRLAPQLGREVFVRGDPPAVPVLSSTRLEEGDLYALMRAYADQRRGQGVRHYRPAAPQAYPLEEARERLRHLLPELRAWRSLAGVAPMARRGQAGPTRASYLASTLSASLELVKEGALEARQGEAFSDVYLRSRLRLDAAE